MIRAGLLLSCPQCESTDLTKVTGSRPDPRVGTLIFLCNECHNEWQFSAVITPIKQTKATA